MWTRLDNLMQGVRCMVGFFSNMQSWEQDTLRAVVPRACSAGHQAAVNGTELAPCRPCRT